MIQIFNIQLNGVDADKFCDKSATEKFAWIKKRLPFLSDWEIDDFLKKDLKHSKAGCGCTPTEKKNEQAKEPVKKVKKKPDPEKDEE